MNPFETMTFLRFVRVSEEAGYSCTPKAQPNKLLLQLSIGQTSAGKIEFYRPDDPRFGQIHPAHRDRLRELWELAWTSAAVEQRASAEFEHYLRIYEPYRHEYIEFSAIADCVIRLYESDGMPPLRREELITDLCAAERAYDAWRKR